MLLSTHQINLLKKHIDRLSEQDQIDSIKEFIETCELIGRERHELRELCSAQLEKIEQASEAQSDTDNPQS